MTTDESTFRDFVNKEMDDSWFSSPVPVDDETQSAVAAKLKEAYDTSARCWRVGDTVDLKIRGLEVFIFSELFDGDNALLKLEDRNGEPAYQVLASKLFNFIHPPATTQRGKERDFVNISFQISESDLSHQVDYDAFVNHLESVFNRYYEHAQRNSGPEQSQEGSKDGYIAPYFAFVQSSGMGKTKILYHFAKNHQSQQEASSKPRRSARRKNDTPRPSLEAILILCRAQRSGNEGAEEGKVFDKFLDYDQLEKDIREKCDGGNPFDDGYRILSKRLNALIDLNEGAENNQCDLALLFDESQYLLRSIKIKISQDGEVKEHSALLFRLIRLWLAKKREQIRVVAVFSGTNSSLRNYRELDHLHQSGEKDSRQKQATAEFYPRGRNVFEEFFALTTTGVLRNEMVAVDDYKDLSDYGQAVPYGRPLFARMYSEGKLTPEATKTIAGRMLMAVQDEWKLDTSKAAWMSILGTRVQMGHTSMDIASSLVAGGYANLVGTNSSTAKICFGPDPVCANVAMCLMDEEWSIEIAMSDGERRVYGKDKKWWSKKACELFSERLAVPEKGDFGEVLVALYFLFCADEDRRPGNGSSATCQTFSVGFEKVVDRLVNGGRKKEVVQQSAGPIFFSTIQVCRNYLRLYKKDWTELGEQGYLEHLYRSGVGFYVFADCWTIDMVFPLKFVSGEGSLFFPMVVSVKAKDDFKPAQIKKEMDEMAEKAKQAKWKRGLCLLVLLGTKQTAHQHTLLSSSDADELQKDGVIGRVLYIPHDDKFGISEGFNEIVSIEEMPEILASHSFVGLHSATSLNANDFPKACLRRRSDKEKNDRALNLMTALAASGGKASTKQTVTPTAQKKTGQKKNSSTPQEESQKAQGRKRRRKKRQPQLQTMK